MIEKEFIKSVKKKIEADLAVSEVLPQNGLIYIEKPLPYICVYRFKKDDPYFIGLVKTQASYIIAEAGMDISKLLEKISLEISKKFQAFLIFEMWPVRTDHRNCFHIYCPEDKAVATVKALREGFEKMESIFPRISAEVVNTFKRHRAGLEPLLEIDESKEAGSLVIGIAVPGIYQNLEEELTYSIFYRKFSGYFAQVIQRAAFEFIRVQTANPFGHFLMLGKTQIEEITLESDRALARISEKMDFLLRVTPVNGTSEWKRFEKSKFTKCPSFNYRLIALDPEKTKREIYNLPLEEIEDPTLAYILRDKRLELEKQLTMLEERGTENFLFIGGSLYGRIEDHVVDAANLILNMHSDHDPGEHEQMNSHEFATQAQKELDYYQHEFPDIPLSLEIRKDVNGIMVSKNKLLISDKFSLDESRCDALIQHEISTHILTYCNGRNQPLRQMYAGFSGYDQLQEGLAVLAEYLVGGLNINRMRTLAGRVIAADSIVKGADFIETFNLLRSRHFTDYSAYYITMRIYRGGGLIKDAVYLAGLLDVLNYIKKGRNIEILYTGKFNMNHVTMIEELMQRGIVHPAKLPRFLQRDSVKERLQKLRKGIEVTELLE